MKTTNITDYVERYLDGKLKDGDLWEFRVNLKNNKELARELQLQQEINETLSDTAKMQLRRNLENTYSRTQYANSFSSKWRLQAAAAAVVIMMLAGGGIMFNYLQTSTTSNMALYDQYFETDNTLFTVRGDESMVNNSLEEGVEAFNKKDYIQAIMLLNEAKNNMAANLYIGFSYMKLSNFDKAIIKFNEIIEDNNNLFIDQAEFNLALCYLASDNEADAKKMFNKIINENTAYSAKATKLMGELDKDK
jgi:tetratricopeptide (TPR) repeat protein